MGKQPAVVGRTLEGIVVPAPVPAAGTLEGSQLGMMQLGRDVDIAMEPNWQ